MIASPLRIERHDTGPPAPWRASLDNAQRLRAAIMERAPRPSDGADLLACDRTGVALLALLDARPSEIAQACALAAGAGAAAALGQAAEGGAVLLGEPGIPPRRIPAGPAGMTPTLWRDALMLALIVRDQGALAILAHPTHIAACQLPASRADSFWPQYCRALADVAVQSDDAAPLLESALGQLARPRIADSEVIDAIDRPVLRLAHRLAIAAADWDAAVYEALARHRDYWGKKTRRFNRTGFVALEITGLCAAAAARGIPTHVDSPYLPRFLFEGVRASLSHVARLPAPHPVLDERAVESPDPATRGRMPPETRPQRPDIASNSPSDADKASPFAKWFDSAPEAIDIASALAAEEVLKTIVRPVLEGLRGQAAPLIVASLRPREEDFGKVFLPATVEAARDAYARFWRSAHPFPRPDALHSELQIFASPAGMLREENLLSRHFPQGYRAIARMLDPHRVWVAWSYLCPGTTGGLAYDGLVWCDDHWAWFPRPYSVLGRPVRPPRNTASRA
jgi:hypothetical protein